MQRGEIWFAATPSGDRPVLILTRDPVADRIGSVVVAALTRVSRGLVSEFELLTSMVYRLPVLPTSTTCTPCRGTRAGGGSPNSDPPAWQKPAGPYGTQRPVDTSNDDPSACVPISDARWNPRSGLRLSDRCGFFAALRGLEPVQSSALPRLSRIRASECGARRKEPGRQEHSTADRLPLPGRGFFMFRGFASAWRKLRGRPDVQRVVDEVDKLRDRPDTQRVVDEVDKLRDRTQDE